MPPRRYWDVSPIEIINPVLLIGDSTPDRRGDIGFARCRNTQWDTDRSIDTQYLGNGLVIIFLTGNTADIVWRQFLGTASRKKGSTGKPVCRPVCSGQKHSTSDILPVGIDRQLFAVNRRIGHDRIFPAMMDNQLAVNIFKNGRIASCI